MLFIPVRRAIFSQSASECARISLASPAIWKNRAKASVLPPRETFIEDIADHGDRPLGAKTPLHLVHADQPPEPARFERHAESPKVQGGIDLAIRGFLIEQRGRAIEDRRLRGDIKMR